MCSVCGCNEGETRIEGHIGSQRDSHHHFHRYPHDHLDTRHTDKHTRHTGKSSLQSGIEPAGVEAPGLNQNGIVLIEQHILSRNEGYAAQNRQLFADQRVLTLNLVSSPGSGKTTLLTTTIEGLINTVPVAVIEGDQETANDADRIRATGAAAIQINTGRGCHLDAHMIGHALAGLRLEKGGVLFIENVGNLVCPASFSLGENHKVVILSVTEGEDKPVKYPDMFAVSDLMILSKIDLLPYVDFEVERCVEYARRVNPDIAVIQLSAVTGEGLDDWTRWIHARRVTTNEKLPGR